MKYVFTLAFLVWEAWLRLRGSWRRREWRKLAGTVFYWALVALFVCAWVTYIVKP